MMHLKTRLRHLAQPLLRHLVFSLPIKTAGGKVWIPILEGTGLGVYEQLRGGEDAWKLALYRDLPADREGLFLDVGANLGQTLIEVRQVDADWPYLGFEPNPDCLHYIYHLARTNGYRNLDLLAVGIGASTGVLSLYLPRGRSTDSTATLIADLRPTRELESRHVPIFNETHLAGLMASRRAGFVKIDVEGAELEVVTGLRGLLERDRPPLLCEVLFTAPGADLETSRTRNAQLMELLQGLEYRVLQIQKSPDLRRTVGLTPIEVFPSDYHRPANAHQCDYLFLPREGAEAMLGRVGV